MKLWHISSGFSKKTIALRIEFLFSWDECISPFYFSIQIFNLYLTISKDRKYKE